MAGSWSLLGTYEKQARTSFFAMALAIYVAAETFGSHHFRYKILMCLLILISGAYIAYKAARSHSIIGIATSLVSLIWILPIVNEKVFYTVDLSFMLAHSTLSLLVAVGAFTYMKN